jgi:hypothetical protein
MRIDTTSLIAAQSTPRPAQAPKPAPQGAPAVDNSLFEPLIFREVKEPAPAKPLAAGPQTPLRRPGALVDITV